LASLIEESRKLERELREARRKLAMGGAASGSAQPLEEIGGVKFFSRVVSGIAMNDLKSLADEAKLSVGSGVVAIVGIDSEGKAGIVVGVTPDLTGRFDAVQLVRPAAAKLGGKGGGGGRRDMAQAGGPHGTAAKDALAAVGDALREIASAA
jgi:alanyl-tRNA synthetase